jgi:hypothetical protein
LTRFPRAAAPRCRRAGTSEADDRGFGASPEVRAPIPTRTDRLYGDEFAAVAAAYPRRAAANPVPAVDAFRDFRRAAPPQMHARSQLGGCIPAVRHSRAALRQLCPALASPAARCRAEEAAGSGAVAGGGLASLYEPPRDILFTGSFEDAKHEAAGSGRWLVRAAPHEPAPPPCLLLFPCCAPAAPASRPISTTAWRMRTPHRCPPLLSPSPPLSLPSPFLCSWSTSSPPRSSPRTS